MAINKNKKIVERVKVQKTEIQLQVGTIEELKLREVKAPIGQVRKFGKCYHIYKK